MHAAGGAVVAFGGSSDAAIDAAGAVDGFDDAQHGEVYGGQGKAESAAGALVGFEETVAGKILHELGEERRGNVGIGGDGLGHGVFAGRERGDVDDGAEGVFGRAGIDHIKIPVYLKSRMCV